MKQLLLTAGFVFTILIHAFAQKSEVFIANGKAIGGYDAVAYFTQAKPVKGDARLSYSWKNADWLFASQANLELFKSNPEKYAPQYGGYCAFGTSNGYKASTEADAWTIVNNKLYLNYNKEVRETWNKDWKGYIKKADVNWPKIKNKE